MASISVSSIVFKTLGELDLKLEIFQRTVNLRRYTSDTPIVFFIHGGGLVGFNREHVPPHVIQLASLRNWPVASVDYRLLPQAKGADVFDDVKDAYAFVRENLSAILSDGKDDGKVKNILLVGQSAGSYLAYLGGLYLDAPPIGILTYFGFATLDEPYFNKPAAGSPKLTSPESVAAYLNETVNTNTTPDFNRFDPSCLLDDLSRNPEYTRPPINFDNPADKRLILWKWLVQESGLRAWFEGLDKSLDDAAWKSFPETVMIHGDADAVTPLAGSEKLLDIIGKSDLSKCSLSEVLTVLGPTRPKLFVAKGQGHSFDQPLYLGDEGFEPIREAWKALDVIVQQRRSF